MLEVASSVGEVTASRIVLMGHSHHGSLERRGEVIYGNSGSWLDGSHLVARRRRHGGELLEVELRRWRNGGITVLEKFSIVELPADAVDEVVSKMRRGSIRGKKVPVRRDRQDG